MLHLKKHGWNQRKTSIHCTSEGASVIHLVRCTLTATTVIKTQRLKNAHKRKHWMFVILAWQISASQRVRRKVMLFITRWDVLHTNSATMPELSRVKVSFWLYNDKLVIVALIVYSMWNKYQTTVFVKSVRIWQFCTRYSNTLISPFFSSAIFKFWYQPPYTIGSVFSVYIYAFERGLIAVSISCMW